MLIDKLLDKQSIIVSLDVDNYLFERLHHLTTAGFHLIEINSTDSKLLSAIKEKHSTITLGACGIIDTQQLEECYQAGIHFASSPGFSPPIAQTANVYSICYFPGVATVSEAMAANSLGFHHVRPYPASYSFCTLLNKSMPKLNLLPAEVEYEEVEHFLNVPSVVAVVVHNPDIKQLNTIASSASLAMV